MNPLIEVTDCFRKEYLFVDCRHALSDVQLGQKLYKDHHLPNAIFANLENDLSDPKKIEKRIFGRHPLPNINNFIDFLQLNGVNSDSHLVAYDDDGGIFAARFWWMIKWIGHEKISILNGGLNAWKKSGNPLDKTLSSRPRGNIQRNPGFVHEWRIAEISAWVNSGKNNEIATLIDARMSERYNGHVEPVDSKSGHITGAINRPYTDNLDADGYFKSSRKLKQEFMQILNQTMVTALFAQ